MKQTSQTLDNVATALTVYGIETTNKRGRHRIRLPTVATALTVYGIETFHRRQL